MIEKIIISDQDFYEILSVVGYPVILLEDLELNTKEDIIKYCIIPAIREYYIYFPIIYPEIKDISGNFEYDFPTPCTYGVANIIFNNRINTNYPTLNPFANERFLNIPTINSPNNWYDMDNARLYERMSYEAKKNMFVSIKFNVYPVTKKVKGYTNDVGTVTINWATFSENFSDINFEDLKEVFKLCKANVLAYFILLRSQQDSRIETAFNIDEFKNKEEKYREEVIDNWKNRTKAIVMRG